MKKTMIALVAVLTLVAGGACDSGGVPVRLRIDEFTMALDVDEMLRGALGDLQGIGLIADETSQLPELWPANLPDVKYSMLLAVPPVPVDLTPDPNDSEGGRYDDISAAAGVINRIDLNRLVLRVETNTVTVALPELIVQVADDKDANQADRLAWRTIGTIPSAEAGFIGDLEFEFLPGGESFLKYQLADEAKEFSLRIKSRLILDTLSNPRMPSGKAGLRLIVVGTFFVDAAGALGEAT